MMNKGLLLVYCLILIIVLLLPISSCSPGGKAIQSVSGDAYTQANIYMARAENKLDEVGNALNEGNLSGAEEELRYAGSYLTYAENAIKQIPYSQQASRETLQNRYNTSKNKYELLKEDII